MKKRKLFVSIMAGLLAFLMIFGIVASLIPTRVDAASSSEIRSQIDELKSQQEELEAQQEALQGQYEENENEIINLVNQKNAIDQEIALLYQEIDIINQQIAAYSLLIADKQDELDEAQARLAELNEKNRERIRSMEEEGDLSYWSVLFKASSFADLLDRINMIEEIAAADRRRLDELSQAAEAVEQARDELATEKSELEDAREELDDAQATLEVKRGEADALLTELIARGHEFELLLDESEALQDELMQEIAQAEKELKEAEYQEWLATYVPPTTLAPTGDAAGSTQAPSSSGWIRPLASWRVTSAFGMRLHPILGYERMHNGIDLGAAEGTPIYAARSGKVTTASFQANGAGNYVSINHGDGFSSIYMHMTRYIVSAGQYVNAGQVIGYVGNTGLSKGAHLHFGIAYNGTYVNPLNYVS